MYKAKFQSFEDRAERAASLPRVGTLRTELARRGLTGWVVPRADRHQNEYVPDSDERLAWLTGFTGSAGAAVVLMERAALFADGRYTLQVRDQVDTSIFEIVHMVESPPDQWIERNLTSSDRLGYDPWLHTSDGAEKLAKACIAAGATLVAVDPSPLDAVWTDRPSPPLGQSRSTTRVLPARKPSPSSPRSGRRSPNCAPTRSSFPIRMRSPGRSISVVGRRPHAATDVICHRAAGGARGALCRWPQIVERSAPQPRSDRRCPRARRSRA